MGERIAEEHMASAVLRGRQACRSYMRQDTNADDVIRLPAGALNVLRTDARDFRVQPRCGLFERGPASWS